MTVQSKLLSCLHFKFYLKARSSSGHFYCLCREMMPTIQSQNRWLRSTLEAARKENSPAAVSNWRVRVHQATIIAE